VLTAGGSGLRRLVYTAAPGASVLEMITALGL